MFSSSLPARARPWVGLDLVCLFTKFIRCHPSSLSLLCELQASARGGFACLCPGAIRFCCCAHGNSSVCTRCAFASALDYTINCDSCNTFPHQRERLELPARTYMHVWLWFCFISCVSVCRSFLVFKQAAKERMNEVKLICPLGLVWPCTYLIIFYVCSNWVLTMQTHCHINLCNQLLQCQNRSPETSTNKTFVGAHASTSLEINF
jgi:hypothetical protein